MVFSERQIKRVVSLLKLFYLIPSVILVLLVVIIFLLSGKLKIEGLLAVLYTGVIYLGLKTRKPWVIPLVVITSSIGLVSQILHNPNTLVFLVFKWLGIVLSIFEIYFFTRKEVRKYFKAKGIFLFG